jgi:glycosyltransferase involved in cell wall biosynthesis
MHFSLIVATVGRTTELDRLFETLCRQTHQDFDTVIVDQNQDDRVEKLVASYQGKLRLRHVRAEKRGHASANNVGLEHATGDLIGFPDDDCWYPADLLERVDRMFREHPEIGGFAGREATGKWHPHAGRMGRLDLWKRHISFALFYRRSLIDGLAFDKSLGTGAGTRWGSGEETDYLIRAMRRGTVFYDPSIVVNHPAWAAAPYSRPIRQKARSYGVGMGHVLRMHGYPLPFAAWQCMRPLAGAALAASRGRFAQARFHLAIMAGRAEGWMATHPVQSASLSHDNHLPRRSESC